MNTDNKTDSYRVQHTHKTRNTDTIKNTYVRKLTSIALMAIMVGGGLTFAIPGMEPAQAAQISSNPNLKVSAEGQNADNEIAHTNIVEVVVIDDLNSADDASAPIVTVDGNPLTMRQNSGGWYGYFASAEILNAGLTDDGIDGLVSNPPSPLRPTVDADLVQTFTLDGDFDVVYQRPGGDQTVSMELDDPDTSVSLDRANYPQNTDVVITLDDQALNVDPTGEDTWYFTTRGAPLYGADAGDDIERESKALKDRQDARDRADKIYEESTADPAGTRTGEIEAAEAKFDEVNIPAQERLKDTFLDDTQRTIHKRTGYRSAGTTRQSRWGWNRRRSNSLSFAR